MMVGSNRVSVIMPLYNAEAYMRNSIKSIIGQSHKDIEIILVDDGSSDETLTVAYELASVDNRISVIPQKNAGPGSARNNGLDHCHGQFVCFIDSDDYLEKDAIQTMLEAFEEDVDIVQCRAMKVYDDGRDDLEIWEEEEQVLTSYEAMKDYLYNPKPIIRFAVWAKLFRREVIENIRFPLMNNSEDVVFNAEAICRCRSIKYIPRTLYRVAVRDDSLSHRAITEEKVQSSMRCNELLVDLLNSKDEYRDLIARAYWSSITTMLTNACVLQKENIADKKRIIRDLGKQCKHLNVPKGCLDIKQTVIRIAFQNLPVCVSFMLKNKLGV